MGNWNITIQGVGAHHNKDNPNDVDKMVDRFVDELIYAGHSLESVTITYGGRQIIHLGQKKAKEYEERLAKSNREAGSGEQQYLESIRSKKTFLE